MNNQIQINREKNVDEIIDQFNEEIKKKIFTSKFEKILFDISSIYQIPISDLKFKVNQIIFNDYNFEKNRFLNLYNSLKIYLYFLSNILSLLVFNLFKINTKFKKEYELILPDIEKIEQILRLEKIFEKKKVLCFLKKKKLKKDLLNFNIQSVSLNFLRFDKENFSNNRKLFQIIVEIFKISKQKRINYFYILNIIFLSIFKNSTIFKSYKSKYLLIDRFYSSCTIVKHFFKKNGGKLSMSTQKSLLETSLTNYSNFDILFTLGEEKVDKEKLIKYGKIGEIYPLGSFFYEHRDRINKISKKNEYEFDIVFLGINFTRNVFMSNNVINGYYEALSWLKKYSEKKPDLKIVIKHHDQAKIQIREREMFNESNIKFIENSKFYGESYDYCFNSKIICSFGSALLLESAIFNNNIFFLNPDNLNKNFFEIQKFEELQIKKYQDMEDKFSGILYNKKTIKIDTNKYCLKDYPSNNIMKFFDSN
tara:strand:- start:12475 stop:13911 length:1437 start_codon:yes stop_codon:yes gene_type:complete